MTAGVDEIVAIAARAVGRCRMVADLSWPHGESQVVELESVAGRRVVGKAHRQVAKFDAEVAAYERWVPALGSHAPQVVVVDKAARVLVLTKVDGAPAAASAMFDPDAVHHRAGELLARFHAAEPPTRLAGYGEALRARLSSWLQRAAPGLLDPQDVAFVTAELEVIDGMPAPFGVPCHRDWQPRNWFIGRRGDVSAIDFEHARVSPWHEDLHRLWWNEWAGRPELAAAFLDGYGRDLDAPETHALMATSLLGHLVTIVWASEHADADFEHHARRCLAWARGSPDRPWPTRPPPDLRS